MSNVLYPLNKLTQRNVPFQWGPEQSDAFSTAKEMLVNSSGLALFNPKLPIVLTCDSSSYGVGSVLSVVDSNGVERPVLFHSATLSPQMQKFSQLEREALAIVTAVKRFHKYIFGRKFVIRTDHKALQYIFHPSKNIPAMTAAKLQRWSLFLSVYDYELNFVPGKDIGNADGLSRNPLSDEADDVDMVNGLTLQCELPITAADVAKASRNDALLSTVINSVWRGWSTSHQTMHTELRVFYLLRHELSVEEGVLLRGHRVVIPTLLRGKVLSMLHEGHPGVVRSKILARNLVWWPGIDNEIESMIRQCVTCQVNLKCTNTKKTEAVWPKPDKVWDRIHIDFFDFDSSKYLILADAFSGWIECWKMTSTNAKAVIARLSEAFATFSLPGLIVSDNGPPFASTEIADFCRNNGIKLVHSPPYHPQSNSHAERAVGTIKNAFRQCGPQVSLSKILFYVRMTPRACGQSPFEIVFRRAPNTRLSALAPKNTNTAMSPIVVKCFEQGAPVYVSTAGRGKPVAWEEGRVVCRESPTTYRVHTGDRERLTHVDFLRPGHVPCVAADTVIGNECAETDIVVNNECTDTVPENQPDDAGPPIAMSNSPVTVGNSPEPLRRSQRVRRPPERLNL